MATANIFCSCVALIRVSSPLCGPGFAFKFGFFSLLKTRIAFSFLFPLWVLGAIGDVQYDICWATDGNLMASASGQHGHRWSVNKGS